MAESVKLNRKSVVNDLLGFHSEFRRLYRNHDHLHTRISALDGQPHRNTVEEMERRDLQKKKLLEKDRMEEIILRHSVGEFTV